MSNSGAVPATLSADMHAWISGLAEACDIPWRWRDPLVLEIGPGEPWVAVLVHFAPNGEWQTVWFERSPAPALQRGAMPDAFSAHRAVRHVYLEVSTSLAWNSWLSWFEQRHGILEPLPEWVSRGMARKSLQRDSEARGSASARQGGNYRRAAQRAHEVLAASHREEYESLLEQFLVLEGLSS